jgi:tetratricopeptide (TPR) repeat protein
VRDTVEQTRFKILPYILVSIWSVLAYGLFLGGCGQAIRVPVSKASEQDILRGNAAAQEGDISFARKDFYSALIKYLESVRLNPNSEYVYNKLGIAYSQLTYFPQAEECFGRSIQLNPKYPYSYNNLGSVYFAQKNLKKAEKYFKKAISLKGNEASFHINLSTVYLEKKKDNKAREELTIAVKLDPNILSRNSNISLLGGGTSSKRRHLLLAQLLASQGEVESAIENLKLAIDEGFTDIESIRKLPEYDPIRKDKRFVQFMEQADLLIRLRAKVGLPENPSR